MTIAPKKVVRLSLWTNPAFDEILGDDPGISLKVLDIGDPEERNWEQMEQADIYHISAAKDEVPATWLVSSELIRRCPNLACVSTSGAGYDTVDVTACTEAGILVVNQAGGNANSVAEMSLGLMLAVSRRIVESDNKLKTETGFSREDLMGHELSGKVLGLVGLGHIGTRVARLGLAFGMQVLAHDPYLDPADISARGARPVSLEQLLSSSDIVSLHCPRNSETEGMFDAQAYRRMKQGALFISTARGGIHDEQALYRALVSGHLSGAGLDVWKVEPPAPDHPLLRLDNVVSTFHTAGVTHEARKNVAAMAAEQIVDICSGRAASRVINKEVLPRFQARFC
jgi:D-3-phosphoglycerate dehydrogenase